MKIRSFFSNIPFLIISSLLAIIPLVDPGLSFAAENWSVPQDISRSTVALSAPSITAGGDKVFTAWHTPGGGGTQAEVFIAERSGTSWSSPSIVNPGTIGPHSIATGLLGKLHLIYTNLDPPNLLYHRTFSNSSWSDPNAISEQISGTIQWPSITIDSSDNLHIVWPFTPTGNNARVYYSKLTGDGWIEPQALSLETRNSYLPRIAIDSNGNVHTVWYDSTDSTVKEIYYRKLGSEFATLLTNPTISAGDPDIAVDKNGIVHVVWIYATGNYDVYHTYLDTNLTGPTWSAPENVTNTDKHALNPSIATDPEGNLHLVWYENSEIYYKRREGGTWFPIPINLSNNPSTSWHPNIISDSNGGLHVVWLNNTNEGNSHVFYSTLAAEGKKLNVELMRSTWEPWNDDVYDHADIFNPGCGTTIAQCGCVLTSIAMLLNYHGATTDMNGNPTTPETLNNFFKLDESPTICKIDGIAHTGRISKGYSCGGVIWTAADEYSKKANDVFGTQKVRFVGKFSGHNPDLYRQEVDNGNPIIAEVLNPNPHWLLINGYFGDTFHINDPGFERDGLNNPQLQNTTLSYARYEKADSDFSQVLITASNPDQVLVTGPGGNQTGFNPETSTNINNIPGSSYFYEPAIADDTGINPPPHSEDGSNILYINFPKEGTYHVKIIPGSDGPFGYGVYAYDHNANLVLNGFAGEAITSEEKEYKFEYNPEPGETTLSIEIPIDIQPFIRRNLIFLKRNHIIPVAILSTETFNPSKIDNSSLTFGRTGGENSLLRCFKYGFDFNRDGVRDKICLFRSKPANFYKKDTQGILKGQGIDGVHFKGSDSVTPFSRSLRRIFPL